MAEYMAILLVILVIYVVSAGRRLGHMSVLSVFVYVQAVMSFGTLPNLDPSLSADRVHGNLLIGTFVTLILTGIVYSYLFSAVARKDFSPSVEYTYPPKATWMLVAISVLVCSLYYWAIGYIAFFDSIESIIQGSDTDIAGLRIESYSGSRYLFPGYVNQFKNALLPALAVVIVAGSYHYRRRSRHVVAIILVLLTLLFLLGTGQRAPIVRAIILCVIIVYIISPRKFTRYIPVFLAVGLPLFFLTTFATGRASEDLAKADGLLGTLSIFFDQLLYRIFDSSQSATLVGFRWAYGRDIPFGSEWWQSIVGLLPGQTGPDTASKVFEVIYGSTRGTAPLSLWASSYYNFGFAGTIFLAFILAFIFARVSSKALKVEALNILQAAGIAGVTISLGLWNSEGPTTPFNTGLVVYIFLYIWGSRIQQKRHVLETQLPVEEFRGYPSSRRKRRRF